MNFRILSLLALRNIFSHRVKSIIVGGIMFFGTFLVVFGNALLDSVQASMEKSITSSMSGDLQVYSADAADALELFGAFGMGSSDIGEITDFQRVETSLLKVDNVESVVPMGITIATAYGGNDIDKVLDGLRDAAREQDDAKIELFADRVKRICLDMQKDEATRAEISGDPEKMAEDKANLDKALSEQFWADFKVDPFTGIDFLERKIAPMAADARLLYLRTIGTDLDKFTQSFDRFEVVKGEMVPTGHRGYLLSDRFHEKFVKNLAARELDDIYEAVHDDGTVIADDTLLQEKIKRNSKQYKRILYQLDAPSSAALESKLREFMPGEQGDLSALLEKFLMVDDSNLDARYKFFYDNIAPHITLYDVNIGDTLTLRAYTKSGYVKSINVKVYGTYRFKGLEKSDLAGASNLTDLVTWREIYGKMSDDQRAELDSIKTSVGVQDVTRENVEDQLFGGGGSIEIPADMQVAGDASGFDEFAGIDLSRDGSAQAGETFDPTSVKSGLALNAAIILKDPSRAAETTQAINTAISDDELGLQVVDWQQAAGLLGQFVTVMRTVLFIAIFIIFLVALVIINNAMVMATMERTPELGTMRAIGAKRSFVMLMILTETVMLGALAGGLGALAASAAILALHQVGLPAFSDFAVVLFAGPRLYPTIGIWNLVFGFVTILVVSLLSTLYPAALAALVPPVVAMQAKE